MAQAYEIRQQFPENVGKIGDRFFLSGDAPNTPLQEPFSTTWPDHVSKDDNR